MRSAIHREEVVVEVARPERAPRVGMWLPTHEQVVGWRRLDRVADLSQQDPRVVQEVEEVGRRLGPATAHDVQDRVLVLVEHLLLGLELLLDDLHLLLQVLRIRGRRGIRATIARRDGRDRQHCAHHCGSPHPPRLRHAVVPTPNKLSFAARAVVSSIAASFARFAAAGDCVPGGANVT